MKLVRLFAATLLLTPLAAAADEFRWSRPVEVARSGAVLIELDGKVAERAELDLVLLGPDGREVDFGLYGPASLERPVKVARVIPGDGGWQVELDAGAAPPRHDRLRFALAKETAADDVLLEGSADGVSFSPLARGNLFRLGSEEELQNLEIGYEPTQARYLRLSWPRGAGLPELLDATIQPAIGGGEPLALPIDCSGAGSVLDCRLTPPAECGLLEVALAPRQEPLAYQLFCACDGEWATRGAGEQRRQGLLKLEVGGGLQHRLRLQSSTLPEVEAAACRPRKKRLSFDAETAGTYLLTYGRTSRRDRRTSATRPGEPTAPAAVGAEVVGQAPAWPDAVKPGLPLSGEPERSWPIERKAEPGRLLALTLPVDASLWVGDRAGGLRIDAGGAQLPFVAEAAAPEKLLAATLHPAAVPGVAGRSRAEIDAPGTGGTVEIFLYARGPFERRVRFLRDGERRPAREVELASQHWSCPASGAGACLLQVRLPLPATERPRSAGPAFLVEFDDGDNPPLREVEAELWAPTRVLYFVDPGGPLTLRWDRRLAAPSYDFAGLASVLYRPEAALARLGAPLAGSEPAEAPGWLLKAAIAAAAVALLAVLARMIRQHPA